EYAVFVGAGRVLARPRESPLELIQPRVHHLQAPLLLVLERIAEVIEVLHRAHAGVVAAFGLVLIAIRIRGLFRAHTGLLPLIRFAQTLSRVHARGLRLLAADVSLRIDAR